MREFNYDAGERIKRRHAFDKVNGRQRRGPGQNALERKVGKILGPSFTYTGDGTFKIDGLKPDFVNKTKRVVVEVYGDYWHRDEPLRKTINKVTRYSRKGWKAIIIWESEVHNPISLRRKLALI